MPEYRRAYAPGGTFFFTAVTYKRRPLLCDPLARRLLRGIIRRTQQRWPFTIDAIVLLPDHLHTLWTLPEGDANFSTRWAYLKKEFTKAWLAGGEAEGSVSESRRQNRRRGVWQRRFWEHTIRDDRDFERHCDYIHFNPVKHGHASCPHAWPYSSFRRWMRRGVYAVDWQCAGDGRVIEPFNTKGVDETAMQ